MPKKRFSPEQTHDGRKVRLMTLIDEFTRECLAIRVAPRINGLGVLESMADAMLVRGIPEHIRSDNGPDMTAKVVRGWLAGVCAKTLHIEPGSPWENGYCESFNGKLRDELLPNEMRRLRQLEDEATKLRKIVADWPTGS